MGNSRPGWCYTGRLYEIIKKISSKISWLKIENFTKNKNKSLNKRHKNKKQGCPLGGFFKKKKNQDIPSRINFKSPP